MNQEGQKLTVQKSPRMSRKFATTSDIIPSCFSLPHSEDDKYPANRDSAFKAISKKLADTCLFNNGKSAIHLGDSLQVIRNIPDSSVDLIVTDPPYHSTKKANIYGDADFEHDDAYFDWMSAYFDEWSRILKPHGSLYLFCSSDMAPHLYVNLSRQMNMHGIITWTKPNEPGYDGWKQKMNKKALRRWYPHTERIIFASPLQEGNLKKSPFGLFLRDCRMKAGLSSNMLTEIIGAYGAVNNGGAVSNWETGRNIPSREQYRKICEAIEETKHIEIMPAYEDVIRAFNVNPQLPFIDTWDFMNVRQYRGKHPAEKPLDMLSHIINTSSYPNDVILDCFSGSGSTNLAAMACGRYSIGIEIESPWAEYSVGRLKRVTNEGHRHQTAPLHHETTRAEELPLFAK